MQPEYVDILLGTVYNYVRRTKTYNSSLKSLFGSLGTLKNCDTASKIYFHVLKKDNGQYVTYTTVENSGFSIAKMDIFSFQKFYE